MLGERDDQLMRIRPMVLSETAGESEMEAFQNRTLRPILKFQNGIILAQFSKYVIKFKPVFKAYVRSAQVSFIDDCMKKDPRLKNSMIASAVGLMTLSEYEFYCVNKNEVNKRIVALIIKRIQDQMEMLY